MTRAQRSLFVVAIGAGTLCAGALASTSSFQTGRFLSGDNEVRAGLFGQNVTIDTLTIGDATYRSERSELMHAMTVRVYADTNGDGELDLLTDEAMASGRSLVGLAIARELNAGEFSTALSAMQGLSLGHMLYTDGTTPVRVDVLLAVSTYDDRPLEDDGAPEAIIIGSFSEHQVRVTAITAGNVDDPTFAAKTATLDRSHFESARTGMDMLTHNAEKPFAISMVGLDQSGDLGVEEGVEVLGYRVEIAVGAPAMFNIMGASYEGVGALAREMPELDEEVGFLGGALGGGGGGGGRGVGRGFGTGAGFRGGGSGNGGFPPFDFNFNPPNNDDIDDDSDSGITSSDVDTRPDGSLLAGNNHPEPSGDLLFGDNEPGVTYDFGDTFDRREAGDTPAPPNPTPVPAPGGIGVLLLALSPRRRKRA